MKVLHVYKSYYPDTIGGIERTIFQISENAAAACVDTVVLSLSEHPHDGPYPIGHHTGVHAKQDCYLFSMGMSLSFFFQFQRLARKVDVIHYHFPWPWMDIACLLFAGKVKQVCTYHSDIVRQAFFMPLYKPLMHAFLRRMDCIVATSANYLATSDILRKHKAKVRIIPIGIEPMPESSFAKDRYEYWSSVLPRKFFLFVGVLRYYKGLHILLDALKGWDVPTVIIGAGPIEHTLKKQAMDLDLQRTQFLGALPDEDKDIILSLAYALVFPSHLRSEAFGISLLEGARAGKPLISSEIGTGTSYINVNGVTGWVVAPGSSQAFHKAMKSLWHDEHLAATMGKNAKARFEDLFTTKKMGDAYNELYKKLVAGEC